MQPVCSHIRQTQQTHLDTTLCSKFRWIVFTDFPFFPLRSEYKLIVVISTADYDKKNQHTESNGKKWGHITENQRNKIHSADETNDL